jgi:hypothetical protein
MALGSFASGQLLGFTVDHKSGRIKEVGQGYGFNNFVIPFMSFCTPGTSLLNF